MGLQICKPAYIQTFRIWVQNWLLRLQLSLQTWIVSIESENQGTLSNLSKPSFCPPFEKYLLQGFNGYWEFDNVWIRMKLMETMVAVMQMMMTQNVPQQVLSPLLSLLTDNISTDITTPAWHSQDQWLRWLQWLQWHHSGAGPLLTSTQWYQVYQV